MRRTLISIIALALIACGGGDEPTDGDTADTVPPADAGPVFVSETDLALDAGTVTVTVTGDLPTPCHTPQTTIASSRQITEGADARPTRIDVTLWSERQGDEPCAEVLEPFEVSVSASVEDGGADVYVNEEFVGSVG